MTAEIQNSQKICRMKSKKFPKKKEKQQSKKGNNNKNQPNTFIDI